MSEPTCSSCRWWSAFPADVAEPGASVARALGVDVPTLGDCTLFECRNFEQVEDSAKLRVTRTQSGEATIVTDADFGCVQWQAMATAREQG